MLLPRIYTGYLHVLRHRLRWLSTVLKRKLTNLLLGKQRVSYRCKTTSQGSNYFTEATQLSLLWQR